MASSGSDNWDAPVPGERFECDSRAGRIMVYVTGTGAPLLLIHSVNAAASAAEVRPLIDRFSSSRQVFSLDLPGFGLSERSDRVYTPRLMTDAILSVANLIKARNPQPVDALAVSLSCEFLARAATEVPALFRSVAFVSPTGFSGGRTLRATKGTTRFKPWLYKLLTGPGSVWGAGLFRQLTRRRVIRYFLKRTWGSARIDEKLWRVDIAMAKSPGAHYAPLYFLSGGLFSADMHTIYEELRMPVWLSHGIRGDFTDYRQTSLVSGRPNWTLTVFDAGALPYFEVPEEFAEYFDGLLLSTTESPESLMPSGDS